jgi:hypothetical protein
MQKYVARKVGYKNMVIMAAPCPNTHNFLSKIKGMKLLCKYIHNCVAVSGAICVGIHICQMHYRCRLR